MASGNKNKWQHLQKAQIEMVGAKLQKVRSGTDTRNRVCRWKPETAKPRGGKLPFRSQGEAVGRKGWPDEALTLFLWIRPNKCTLLTCFTAFLEYGGFLGSFGSNESRQSWAYAKSGAGW